MGASAYAYADTDTRRLPPPADRRACTMTIRRLLGIAAITAAVVALALNAGLLVAAFDTNPVAPTVASLARGAELWQQTCAVCHGPQGRGDGPAAATLNRQPKDLTRIALPPVFPDGIVAYRIANGGQVMPAWKSVLSRDDIWLLVGYIRSQHRPS
jgi:mono/diheme cytochrome c family protein